MLRDFAKENQILSGHFVSEDLLIRSNKEIVKNILPFLKYLLPISTDMAVQDLGSFKRYEKQSYGTSLFEDEARDNFFKEQQIEE